MAHLYPDLVLSALMVGILYILSKRLRQVNSEHEESYVYISAGIIVLAVVSVLNLYEKNQLFSRVSFLSDSTFYQLVRWIGIVVGGTLILRGLSTWIPSVKAERESDKAEIRRLHLLRRVDQLILVESRLECVLQGTLDMIVEQYGLSGGAVLRYSNRQNRHYVNAGTVSIPYYAASMAHVTIDEEGWERHWEGMSAEQSGIFGQIPEQPGPPSLVIPIAVGGKPIAFILGWCNDDTLSREDRRCFKLVADVIGSKVEFDVAQIKVTFHEDRERWRKHLVETTSGKRSVREAFPALVKHVQEKMSIDQCSLILQDRGTSEITILTIGHSGTLVVEKGQDLAGIDPIFRQALEAKVATRVDWSKGSAWERSRTVRFSTLQSLMILPVSLEGRSVALLVGTLGSHTYNLREREYCEAAAGVLSDFIRKDLLRHRAANRDRQFASISAFSAGLSGVTDVASIHSATAQLLASALKADIVRVAGIHAHSAFRVSPAVVCKSFLGSAVSEILAALEDRERKAVRDGVADKADARNLLEELIPESASDLVRNGISASAHVPIVCHDRVVAIITVVDLQGVRNRDARALDTPYTAAVAQILRMKYEELALLDRVAERNSMLTIDGGADRPEGDLRSRVRSSLSGILGSVELLRAHGSEGSGDGDRYLSIIDKSAHRIAGYLQDAELTEVGR